MRAYLAVALILGGCAAAQPTRWEKPGATQEAFMRDRYVCLQQTPQDRAGNYNTTLFAACMGTRGYKEDANGNLFPPPDAQARIDHEQAVANYQSCLAAAKPSNSNACEGQRRIMDASAQGGGPL